MAASETCITFTATIHCVVVTGVFFFYVVIRIGGVVLTTHENKITVNNTLDERLKLIAKEVGHSLVMRVSPVTLATHTHNKYIISVSYI